MLILLSIKERKNDLLFGRKETHWIDIKLLTCKQVNKLIKQVEKQLTMPVPC